MTSVSLIILSYNRYAETTGPCLDSVLADPGLAHAEIIVVDNGSDQPTREALEAACVPGRVRLIANAENLGYAEGNNVGLRVAGGDVAILLNSDTQAPPDMLPRLAGALAADRRLGLLGGVTNSAGTAQRIHCAGETRAEVIARGVAHADAAQRPAIDLPRLDFHCVALSRTVLERVGLFDRAFGLGYYEDTDYCARAHAAGFALAMTESAFVYHVGSASFGALGRGQHALMKENRRRFERKHGPLHRYDEGCRPGNLRVLRSYVDATGDPGLRVRAANRLALAGQLRPHGWWRRWRYAREVEDLRRRLDLP